jgi:large subunit ribosomal protein L30
MIAIIRIHGQVKVKKDIDETLSRLRLRKKYSCVILREKPEVLGMIKKVKDYVAFGKISKETLKELIVKRGRIKEKNKKVDFEKATSEIYEGKIERKFEDFNLKPFFALHPPRKGINSKLHYPKGVLGDNGEKINDLIKRML